MLWVGLILPSHLPGPDQALRLLMYELRTVVADWWPFMLYLGLEQWQLKAIDRDHPTVREKLIFALDRWLNSKREASWTDIVSALRRMEEFEVLASRIEAVYCQSGPSKYNPCPSPTGTTAVTFT